MANRLPSDFPVRTYGFGLPGAQLKLSLCQSLDDGRLYRCGAAPSEAWVRWRRAEYLARQIAQSASKNDGQSINRQMQARPFKSTHREDAVDALSPEEWDWVKRRACALNPDLATQDVETFFTRRQRRPPWMPVPFEANEAVINAFRAKMDTIPPVMSSLKRRIMSRLQECRIDDE